MGGVAGGWQAHFAKQREDDNITAECGCMTEQDGHGNEVVATHSSECELFMDDLPEETG